MDFATVLCTLILPKIIQILAIILGLSRLSIAWAKFGGIFLKNKLYKCRFCNKLHTRISTEIEIFGEDSSSMEAIWHLWKLSTYTKISCYIFLNSKKQEGYKSIKTVRLFPIHPLYLFILHLDMIWGLHTYMFLQWKIIMNWRAGIIFLY